MAPFSLYWGYQRSADQRFWSKMSILHYDKAAQFLNIIQDKKGKLEVQFDKRNKDPLLIFWELENRLISG